MQVKLCYSTIACITVFSIHVVHPRNIHTNLPLRQLWLVLYSVFHLDSERLSCWVLVYPPPFWNRRRNRGFHNYFSLLPYTVDSIDFGTLTSSSLASRNQLELTAAQRVRSLADKKLNICSINSSDSRLLVKSTRWSECCRFGVEWVLDWRLRLNNPISLLKEKGEIGNFEQQRLVCRISAVKHGWSSTSLWCNYLIISLLSTNKRGIMLYSMTILAIFPWTTMQW